MSGVQHTVTVWVMQDEAWTQHTLIVPDGANLRRMLLQSGFTPYARVTQQLNCGGRGLCATCGVWLESNPPLPQHWHDRLAQQFGYPRLSCQVSVYADLTVRILPDKIIWGKRGGYQGNRV
jgi:ferredoxin